MNLADALRAATARGLDRLDAQLLLLHTLGRPQQDRAWLITHDTDKLGSSLLLAYEEIVQRRLQGEPVAYLVGQKEFFGLTLAVDQRVLVPRPDTETLVEWALELLPAPAATRTVKAIDLGTGSGAIALALKHSRPDLRVEAVDASAAALEVARANAAALQLAIEFRQASWLDGSSGSCDLIASNPPYIAAADPHLAALQHEPLSALAAGADGLDDIRTIVEQAPARLAPGGWLLLEHGHDQADAVQALFTAAGFVDVTSRCDLAGIRRCTGGRRLELG